MKDIYIPDKAMDKLLNSMSECTVKCKCSHSIAMPNADRTICSYCGRWCYRTPQIEFRYKMKEKLINEKRNMDRR